MVRKAVTRPLFTSMFVERMEVLEYRQKFEVELSTFPDSTNTETPRKLVFSLTCVRVSVCLSVCLPACLSVSVCLSVCLSVPKSLSVDILRNSRPIWMKISVCVVIGVESRTSPNQYNRTIISP